MLPGRASDQYSFLVYRRNQLKNTPLSSSELLIVTVEHTVERSKFNTQLKDRNLTSLLNYNIPISCNENFIEFTTTKHAFVIVIE